MKVLGAIAVCLCAAGVLAAQASAHADLVGANPAPGLAVAKPPRAVRLFFDDAVTPSVAQVVQNGGGSVVAGNASATSSGHRELVIPLRARLRKGDYTVRWQVISDDGHRIGGVYAFAVGAAAPRPVASLRPLATQPTPADVGIRALLDLGILATFGALGFRVAVWQPALGRLGLAADDLSVLEDRELRRTSVFVLCGCYAAILGASLALVRTPAALPTRYGRMTELAIAAAGLGLACAFVALRARTRWRSGLLVAAGVAASALALVPSLSGHALDRTGARPISFLADLVHVGAAALWLGGLAMLAVIVPLTVSTLERDRRDRLYLAVAERFSRLAFVSVMALIGTGVVRTLAEVTEPQQLWTTAYGVTLLLKIVLLCGLLRLGWRSRSRLVPGLAGAVDGAAAFARLRRNVYAELVLLLVVVGAVALLTQLRPGRIG